MPFENVNFTANASKIRLLDSSKIAINWKNSNDVTICEVALFLLSSLVTGQSFMSISSRM